MTFKRFTLDKATPSLWRVTFNNPPINLIDYTMTRLWPGLASRRFSPLLALEIPLPGRPAASRCGSARIDPADERREPTLGSAAHSW
jgi:hypothetical protein